MKKKTLGRIFGICLAAALTVTSVPVPVMAAEDTNATEVAVDTVDAESTVSDNDSPEGEADDTSAEEETTEEVAEEVDSEDDGSDYYFAGKDLDIFALDYKNADADTINEYLRSVPDATIAAWISGLTDADKAVLMEKGTDLNETLDYYGEDVDAIGLTNEQHFDTAMEYYELLATGKNVYAYFWGSKKG